jgi:peptide/nickel transport system permease protein
MLNYILRRVLYAIPVLLLATFISFWLVRSAYDPCVKLRSTREGAAAVQRCEERLGLDQPVVAQYFEWLGNALQGDLGQSSRTNQDVSEMIPPAFWNTAQLLFFGTLLSVGLALIVGVISATRQYSVTDYTITTLAFIGIAMPPFWFGLLAQQWLAVGPRDWFGLQDPIFYTVGLHGPGMSGFNLDYLRHLFLPVLTLTVQSIAAWSRFQRTSMLDVMSSDYVRTARAKGVPRRGVVWRHGARNALIPFVTVVALDTGALFGGLIITEKIFSIPGMGRLFYESLLQGDVNVIVAWLIIVASFIMLFNLIADVLYVWLDPRVRLT